MHSSRRRGVLNFFNRRGPSPPDRATDEDVLHAYRLILGRQPDPDGFAQYRRLIAEGLSLDRLSRSFFNSDEYRFRQEAEARPTPVDLGGYQVCIQKRDTDFGQTIFHTHQYEEHVRRAVREHLREGDVAIDVGANVGAIAFLAASIVGQSGCVIAIEPNPDNVQLLYRGLRLNGFANMEIFACAASNRRAVFSLTGGTSNTHLIEAGEVESAGFFVQSVAIDDLLGELPRLNFVKMDIEGHEPPALQGMARLIERHRPVLLVEFNPRCLIDLHAQDPLEMLRWIFSFYPRVRVTTAFDDDAVFERPEAVWNYWEQRNRDITMQKILPDRLLHFDLIATL